MIDGCTIDLTAATATRDGARIALTTREVEIVRWLAAHAGQVVVARRAAPARLARRRRQRDARGRRRDRRAAREARARSGGARRSSCRCAALAIAGAEPYKRLTRRRLRWAMQQSLRTGPSGLDRVSRSPRTRAVAPSSISCARRRTPTPRSLLVHRSASRDRRGAAHERARSCRCACSAGSTRSCRARTAGSSASCSTRSRAINRVLRERFVLHWQSVRPVPIVTIDFGDGRRSSARSPATACTSCSIRTVARSTRCPGLFSPDVFVAAARARARARASRIASKLARSTSAARLRQPVADCRANRARSRASAIAMTKHMVEMPILRAVVAAVDAR